MKIKNCNTSNADRKIQYSPISLEWGSRSTESINYDATITFATITYLSIYPER